MTKRAPLSASYLAHLYTNLLQGKMDLATGLTANTRFIFLLIELFPSEFRESFLAHPITVLIVKKGYYVSCLGYLRTFGGICTFISTGWL